MSILNIEQRPLLEIFKEISDPKDDYQEQKSDDLVLFISFDIVNSTKFKNYNYNKWFDIISNLVDILRKKVRNVDENIQVWRTIGDEVVFNIIINDFKSLKKISNGIYKILINLCEQLKTGELFKETDIPTGEIEEITELNLLSLKACAWISLVTNIEDVKDKKSKIYSVKLKYQNSEKTAIIPGQKIVEFQGADIDCGFRISKEFAKQNKLSLSLELAFLLLDECKSKIILLGFETLKGVWSGEPYPIIYYHDEDISKNKFNESFSYNELLLDENVNDYLSYDELGINLEKIIYDRSLTNKIKKLKTKLDDKNSNTKQPEKNNQMIELYGSVICKTNSSKILIFKRKSNNKWDLGCIKLYGFSKDSKIKNILNKKYKEYFNIDLTYINYINEFYINKNGIDCLGLRFEGHVDHFDIHASIKDSAKYVECKEIDELEFENYKNTDKFIDITDLEVLSDIFKKEEFQSEKNSKGD